MAPLSGLDAKFREIYKIRKITRWSSAFPEATIRVMTSHLKRTVGLKLRAERLAQRLTQEQIAEKIGRTVETISNIERGKVYPSLDTLEQICLVMNIPMSHLFEEAGEKQASAHRMELIVQLRILAEELPDRDLEIAVRQIEALAQGRLKKLQ